MKKFAIGCLILLLLIGGGIFFAVNSLPNDYEVTRELTIEAPPEAIYPHIANLESWKEWTVWNTDMDPTATWEYRGPKSGVGAETEWQGAPFEEEGLGHGKMTCTQAVENERVEYDLTFWMPDETEMSSKGHLTLTPADGKTKVTWVMSGEMEGFMGKFFAVMMDEMNGPQFEEGLRTLRDKVEAEVAAAPK